MCVDQNHYLFVEIQKKKKHTRAHTTHHAHAHTPTHHAHAHTAPTRTTHVHTRMHTQHITYTRMQAKQIEGKRGLCIQIFIFRTWSCYLCQIHLLNSKGRVQLHGGAANW
jgi:hypothetical protein